MAATALVIGLGDLGTGVLDSLARLPELERLIGASRDEERGRARTGQAALEAELLGGPQRVEFERIGIADHERLATFGTADFVSEIHIGLINLYFRIALWAGGHTILEGERRSAGNSGNDVPESAGRAHDKSERIA